MRRIAAAGLPLWPSLLFDESKRRAYVTARCPSWKSYELGLKTGEVLTILNLCVCFIVAWKLVPAYESFFIRLLVVFAVWLLIGLPSAKWVRHSVPGVLARQFFAKRVSFWFTESGIAFKSSLYRRGVLLPRICHEVPVELKFTEVEDPQAVAMLTDLKPERKLSKWHFHDARRVNVVVRAGNEGSLIPIAGGDIMRSIPICELMSGAATQIIMVCNAASALTAAKRGHRSSGKQTGIDIDEIHSS